MRETINTIMDSMVKRLEGLGYTARYEPYDDTTYKVIVESAKARLHIARIDPAVGETGVEAAVQWIDMRLSMG